MQPVIDPRLFRVMVVMTIITLPLKGYALWRAAHGDQKGWYVALLVLNTFGLLDLTYLFYFSKQDKGKSRAEH
jgi:hypothetical protein